MHKATAFGYILTNIKVTLSPKRSYLLQYFVCWYVKYVEKVLFCEYPVTIMLFDKT